MATNESRFRVVPAVVMVALPLKSEVAVIDLSVLVVGFEVVVFSRNERSIASPWPRSAITVFMEPVAFALPVPIKPKTSLPAPPDIVTALAELVEA